jgi:hypothetical protein
MMPSDQSDIRITVRLTKKELEQLDALHGLLSKRQFRARFPRPYKRGRDYTWSRGDIVRVALAELERQVVAELGGASDVAPARIPRQTIPSSQLSDAQDPEQEKARA